MSCFKLSRVRTLLAYLLGFAMIATILCGSSLGAIIASEDFESYTTTTDPIGGTGGSGWTDVWADAADGDLLSRLVQDNVFPGMGKAVEIAADGTVFNAFTRPFVPQAGTFYVGFLMRTTTNDPSAGDDFLQFYLNDIYPGGGNATSSGANFAYGGGTLRATNTGAAGNYYLRMGDNTDSATGQTVDSGLAHAYGQDTIWVMKFSKSSSNPADPYDEVALWINQLTEGAPTATISGPNGVQSFTEINSFHVRVGPDAAGGTLFLDSLVLATTYDEAISLIVPEPFSILLFSVGSAIALFIRPGRRTCRPRSK